MLLSIITINRNNAAGLEKTMRSVLSQTFKDIEYIIVDGASTDNSVEVIRSLTPNPSPEGEGERGGESNGWHVCTLSQSAPPSPSGEGKGVRLLWISEPDKGIYNAMNKGIRKATGGYIQILNSGDCLVADDVVERMVGAAYPQPLPEGKGFCMPAGETAISEDLKSLPLGGDLGEAPTPSPLGVALPRQTGGAEGGEKTIEGRGEASILYGNMIKCFPDGRRMQDKCFAGQEITFLGMYTGTLNHDPAWIRRDLFDRYGYYDESLKIVSDWKWYLQALVLGVNSAFPLTAEEVKYIDLDVTLFDMTGISENGGENKALIANERRRVLEQLVPSAFLHDYDAYAEDIYMMRRIRRHSWAYKMTYLFERVLFKVEKWMKNRKNIQRWG